MRFSATFAAADILQLAKGTSTAALQIQRLESTDLAPKAPTTLPLGFNNKWELELEVALACEGKASERSNSIMQHEALQVMLQKRNAAGDDALVNLAAKALEMLASIGPVQGAPALSAEEGEPDLGAFLTSGEMPHAQACVLYILRTGVIEGLGETGQVRL